MPDFQVTKPIDLAQLGAEIAAAERWADPPGLSLDSEDGIGTLVVHRDDADPSKVQSCIAAHTPKPPPPTAEEQIVTLKAQIASLHAADGAFLELIDRM